MKSVALVFLLSVFGAMPGISFAQNSILEGKIVDETNKPAPGAIYNVTKGWKSVEARYDEDGLYYTQLIAAGNYFAGNPAMRFILIIKENILVTGSVIAIL